MLSDDRWWEQALCAEIDPELWYPTKGGSVREAKRMCRRCPVTASCLEETVRIEAQEQGEPIGVRGGLSANERIPLIRQRRGEIDREPPRVSRIRAMVASGMGFEQIAREENIKPASVSAVCRHHDIPVPGRRRPRRVAGGVR